MDNLLKRLIWLYFILLVGEGALRKWIFPSLSDPILIIRDPVVLAIYALALMRGRFPFRISVFILVFMAVGSVFCATIASAPLLVTLYGLRINYLHLPLIFIMADLLDRDDLVQYGRMTLWLTLPIGLLMIVQYLAGEHSWLNVGAGGDTGGQLRGALGKIRPPGPFSFITGPVLWFSLATAYTIYGWMHRTLYSRWLLMAVTGIIAIVIPISVSRMLMLSVLFVVAFGAMGALRHPQRAFTFFVPLLFVAIIYAGISNSEITEAFSQRWESSTSTGLGDSIFFRVLRQYSSAWDVISAAPIFGHGIGMGSNVGARFTSGHMGFQLAEAEWAKIVLELGPILGIAFIIYRCWLSGWLLLAGWKKLFLAKDSLPWLLCGACLLPVMSGQWAPPTILGFAVFGAGLTLAAAKSESEATEVIMAEETIDSGFQDDEPSADHPPTEATPHRD